VEVPDHLWAHCTSGKNKKYSDNQAEDVVEEKEFMNTFQEWVKKFEDHVQKKGKVRPNRYRAYDFKQPPHLWDELKTGIRSWMLRFGKAPTDSSPWYQEKYGLNKDITLKPKKSEGKKLRE
jgi:hypothetical protein